MTELMDLWLDFLRSRGVLVTKTDFIPANVIQMYEAASKSTFERRLIPRWGAFERLEEEWDSIQFSELMGIEEFAQGVPLSLVTDEGYRDKLVFLFLPEEFQDFVNWYEAHYQMDFFQSADYLLFGPRFEVVRIIHHNGVLFSASE
jgi:hypothetical protein